MLFSSFSFGLSRTVHFLYSSMFQTWSDVYRKITDGIRSQKYRRPLIYGMKRQLLVFFYFLNCLLLQIAFVGRINAQVLIITHQPSICSNLEDKRLSGLYNWLLKLCAKARLTEYSCSSSLVKWLSEAPMVDVLTLS